VRPAELMHEIRSPKTYAAALHEIGHCLGRYPMTKSVITSERLLGGGPKATRWCGPRAWSGRCSKAWLGMRLDAGRRASCLGLQVATQSDCSCAARKRTDAARRWSRQNLSNAATLSCLCTAAEVTILVGQHQPQDPPHGSRRPAARLLGCQRHRRQPRRRVSSALTIVGASL
jgi:hypothetical protein